jgi:hypothetical protein
LDELCLEKEAQAGRVMTGALNLFVRKNQTTAPDRGAANCFR